MVLKFVFFLLLKFKCCRCCCRRRRDLSYFRTDFFSSRKKFRNDRIFFSTLLSPNESCSNKRLWIVQSYTASCPRQIPTKKKTPTLVSAEPATSRPAVSSCHACPCFSIYFATNTHVSIVHFALFLYSALFTKNKIRFCPTALRQIHYS